MAKRCFLIILDSFGIGHAPDAAAFGDEGSNTLAAVCTSPKLNVPNLQKLGLFNIDTVNYGEPCANPQGAYARLVEQSLGKDTTIGHWEIAGINTMQPMPVFPGGFPKDFIREFEQACKRQTLCNQPYSGTKVIADYGEQHMKSGALIVYTSADSVFQIAAHEEVVPLSELYRYCEIARELLTGPLAVGRVIARPFVGTNAKDFTRTQNRHDYSLTPHSPTVLNALADNGLDVIGVGKIFDIFAGSGISKKITSKNNADGIKATLNLLNSNFTGLAFINLVDFDMLYGHRNDIDGYATALSEFDLQLANILPLLQPTDLLLIAADHGCDPSTTSSDHSRECVPLLVAGASVAKGLNLGTLCGFGSIANIIARHFALDAKYDGEDVFSKFQT